MPEFGTGLAVGIALVLAMGLVFLLMPSLIRKMKAGGLVGRDV